VSAWKSGDLHRTPARTSRGCEPTYDRTASSAPAWTRPSPQRGSTARAVAGARYRGRRRNGRCEPRTTRPCAGMTAAPVRSTESIAAGEHTERILILDLALALAGDRRRDIARKTRNGLESAARHGCKGGRPSVVDDDKRRPPRRRPVPTQDRPRRWGQPRGSARDLGAQSDVANIVRHVKPQVRH
jgi:hypothetical protein